MPYILYLSFHMFIVCKMFLELFLLNSQTQRNYNDSQSLKKDIFHE